MLRVELIKDWEASTVFPEETDEASLTEHTCDKLGLGISDHSTMDTLAESLNGFDQVGIFVEEGQGLLLAQILDFSQGNWFAFACAFGQFKEIVRMFVIRMRKADDEE